MYSAAFFVSSVAIGVACSSSTTSGGTTQPDAGEPEPEEGDDASAAPDAASSDSAPAADASVDAAPTMERVYASSYTAGQDCSAICATKQATCTPACSYGNTSQVKNAAGQVNYSHTVTGANGSKFTSYEYLALKACNEKIAATYTPFTTKYELDITLGVPPISCCCERPVK